MTDATQPTTDSNVVYLPRYDRAEPQKRSLPGSPPARSESPLGATLQLVREEAGSAALLILRIREYREFVESFGGACGSMLDREISRRLESGLRGSDRVLPLGSGEYAIVMPQPQDKNEVDLVCERLVRKCGGNYKLADITPRFSAAIGISLFPVDSRKVEEVVRFAHIALRRAASGSDSDYHYFSREMLQRQRHKLWMDGELKRALAEDRFILHYQPQYALNTNDIVGMEALVRMLTSDGKMIPPDDFIPIAEENNFIVELGYWVIQEACRQLAQWRKSGSYPKRIAVNVSPRQLQDSELPEVIRKAVTDAGLQHSDLELEVTESCMLEYLPVTGDVLRQLRSRGVRIAIDDFGAGYSCFATLAQLPLDTFKLDRSFMINVASDSRARQVVTAMIAMARELGYEIIAEGVETDQHYWFLQASGCHLVQGYGLARPQDAKAVARLLQCADESAIVG